MEEMVAARISTPNLLPATSVSAPALFSILTAAPPEDTGCECQRIEAPVHGFAGAGTGGASSGRSNASTILPSLSMPR
jgi:hypothetical protein